MRGVFKVFFALCAVWLFFILTGWQSLAIVGGRRISPLAKNHPSHFNTVAIMTKEHGGSWKIFCTGSIISSRIILTARHCILHRNIEDMSIYFGDKGSHLDATLIRPVMEKGMMHDFLPKAFFPSFDVAWLRWEGVLPHPTARRPHIPHFRSVEILHSPEQLFVGLPLTLVGYGATNDSFFLPDEKLITDVHLEEYLNHSLYFHVLHVRGYDGQGPCYGDSGGPAYAYLLDPETRQSKWYLVGVASGLDLILTPKAAKDTNDEDFPYIWNCRSGDSVYNFAGFYSSWIQESTGVQMESSEKNSVVEFSSHTNSYREDYTNFQDWCENVSYKHTSWVTVKGLMAKALDLREPGESRKDIFFNCRRAAELVEGMEKISIDAQKDSFSDFKPLASLTNLKKLSITHAKLEDLDFSPLVHLPQLSSLKLSSNDLRSLKKLSTLKGSNIKTLHLSFNKIKSLQGVENLLALEELVVGNNELIDVISIESLTQLKTLNLYGNHIRQPLDLSRLKNLVDINLGQNKLEELIFYTEGHIKYLFIHDNNIKDIQMIKNLRYLQTLDISKNPIEDLSPLSQLSQLLDLRINFVRPQGISSFDFIEPLQNLRRLELAGNGIEDVSSLSKMEFLHLLTLNLSFNKVRDRRPLDHFKDRIIIRWGGA